MVFTAWHTPFCNQSRSKKIYEKNNDASTLFDPKKKSIKKLFAVYGQLNGFTTNSFSLVDFRKDLDPLPSMILLQRMRQVQ